MAPPRTAAEINRRNEEFWKDEAVRMKERISDNAVVAAALASVKAETQRLPLYYQKPFEMALQEAAQAKQHFLSHMGRDGRKARKPDALQQLIVEIVRRNPSLTERQLRDR